MSTRTLPVHSLRLLLPTVLLACGDGTLDPIEYCERTADMFCAFYQRCDRITAEDPASCRTEFLETCNAVYEPRWSALAEAGRLQLSKAGVKACEEHLETASCEAQLFDLQAGCAGVWEGLTPAGGTCSIGLESFVCAPGTTCVVGLDLCGQCEPVVGVGGECGEDARCAPEASCEDGVCVARPNPGEACEEDGPPCALGASCEDGTCRGFVFVGVGESCDIDHRCAYGSACVGGTCTLQGRNDEPCSEAGCAAGYCDPDGVCRAPRPDGDACGSALECASGICADDVCVPLPSACLQD